MYRHLLLCAAALLSPLLHAAGADEKPLIAQSLEQFDVEATRIHEQMRPGGPYDHIEAGDRRRVEVGLDRIRKLLVGHAGEPDLRREEKVALLNAQEEVNGILHHNDNNRLVCEHVAPVGSHLPVTRCRTYSEIVEQRRADQKFLQDRAMYNH
jgi:hypothetical protein